jgi:NAD(P)-dependent dehydrogenase (short-subunit alcohol dehydrogenase family)
MILTSKTVMVTGGAKGLGRSITEALLDKGARVAVCGRDVAELDKVSKELNVISFPADVSRESDLTDVAQKIVAKYGAIDIWINNAGIWMPPSSLENTDLAKAEQLLKTNFFGTIHGMRAAIRQMKKQSSGTIVNIMSTTAFDGMNGSSGSMYVASKYALRGLTNVVRDELKKTPIKIIGVYPGGIKTDLFHENVPANLAQFMSPEEVAEKIVANLLLEEPELQQILKRPTQESSYELKAIENKNK